MATWKSDLVHSTVGFSVRHLMVSKVRGTFGKWNAALEFDESNPTASTLNAEIDLASIDTREPQRDGHLKSPDFFDVGAHPLLTFKSTAVQAVDKENLKVTGDLTLRGVTRPVTLDVEYAGQAKHPMAGDIRAGFSAKTAISRKDFGLVWNAVLETGGVAVSDKVDIAIDLQAIRVD